jgi:hypothetical protein
LEEPFSNIKITTKLLGFQTGLKTGTATKKKVNLTMESTILPNQRNLQSKESLSPYRRHYRYAGDNVVGKEPKVYKNRYSTVHEIDQKLKREGSYLKYTTLFKVINHRDLSYKDCTISNAKRHKEVFVETEDAMCTIN